MSYVTCSRSNLCSCRWTLQWDCPSAGPIMLCALACSVFLPFSIYNGKDVSVWLLTGYGKFICYEVIQILYPSQAISGIFQLTLNSEQPASVSIRKGRNGTAKLLSSCITHYVLHVSAVHYQIFLSVTICKLGRNGTAKLSPSRITH